MSSPEDELDILDNSHEDLVLSTDYNLYGTRMVTAGADHYLEVWERKGDDWCSVDKWRAHDAEISEGASYGALPAHKGVIHAIAYAPQVKWNGPFLGDNLGSIGEDCKFNLWQENHAQRRGSGRRFQRIYQHSSATRVPYMSMDFKNIDSENFLALITRDGYLSIFAPVKPNSLSTWQPLRQMYVCRTPPPTEETSFRVFFHRENPPSWKSVAAGLDRRAVSLAVLAMNVVKVYRTDKDRRFYFDCELVGSQDILHDVAWANGSQRGFDTIATAGKDGKIRIYELHVPTPSVDSSSASPKLDRSRSSESGNTTASHSLESHPSSSTAGLGVSPRTGNPALNDEEDLSRVRHEVRVAAVLESNHGAVWRLSWSQMGEVLFSTGDDGVARSWKKDLKGEWLEYADMITDDDVSDDEDDSNEDDEEDV